MMPAIVRVLASLLICVLVALPVAAQTGSGAGGTSTLATPAGDPAPRPWLGVAMRTISPQQRELVGWSEHRGVYVRNTWPKSPAWAAGLIGGDSIIAIDGKPVATADDVVALIGQTAVGSQVQLRLWRDGKETTLTCLLAAAPQPTVEEQRLDAEFSALKKRFDAVKDFEELIRVREGFEAGARAGNGRSMAMLGYMYAVGKGVVVDPAQSLSWYRKAASAGSEDGWNGVGLALEEGRGTAKDPIAAFRAYERAAEAGSRPAIFNIGRAYRLGIGVDKDDKKARHWFARSVLEGDADAMTQLGYLHLHGLGGVKDAAQARRLYLAAAEKGNGWAMYNLGYLHHAGEGGPKNIEMARQWYEKAKAAGTKEAAKALDDLDKAEKAQRRRSSRRNSGDDGGSRSRASSSSQHHQSCRVVWDTCRQWGFSPGAGNDCMYYQCNSRTVCD